MAAHGKSSNEQTRNGRRRTNQELTTDMLLSLVTDLLVRVEEATGQPLEISGEDGRVVLTIPGIAFDTDQGLLVPYTGDQPQEEQP